MNYKLKYKKEEPWRLTWYRINDRCNNFKLKWYGGKGIKNLLSLEEVKYLWFKDKASKMKMPSIDRLNSGENYSLDNCRFIERNENSGRGLRNRKLSYEQANLIRTLYQKGGLSMKKLADKFSIDKKGVAQILWGITYKNN